MTRFATALVACLALVACAEKKKAPAPVAKPGQVATAPGTVAPPLTADRSATTPMRKRPLGTDRTPAALPGRDQSGRLTPEERAARRASREERRAEMLATFDADGDGTLSEAERAAVRESRAVEMIDRLDLDKDGKLSVAELAERAAAGDGRRRGPPIERLDTDGDGFVTIEELTAARPGGGPDGGGRRGGWNRPAPATP